MRRGGQHLPQFLADAAGQPAGRVAELLDLRRQRAGAAFGETGHDQPHEAAEDRQRETVPFDRGVVLGIALVEQVAVFDEQQAVDDQRRNAGVVGIGVLREPRAIDLLAVAIEDPQAGPVFFAIDREPAEIDEAVEPLRPPRLAFDREIVRGQRRDELRQPAVAEPLVIGAAFRKADRVVGAGLRRHRHAVVDAGEQPGFETRGMHLVNRGPADQPQQCQQHRPAQQADEMQRQAAGRPQQRDMASLSRLATRRIETREPSPYGVGDGHVGRSSSQRYPGSAPDGTGGWLRSDKHPGAGNAESRARDPWPKRGK